VNAGIRHLQAGKFGWRIVIKSLLTFSARARPGILRARAAPMASGANAIRRVLVASITGSLPDEFRAEAMTLLIEAINAPDEEVRGLAVIALCEIGGSAPAVLPALTDALNDSSEVVRKRAARALGELGIAAIPVLPHLTAGLQDEAISVRLECAAALGRIGPEAATALPLLFTLLTEDDIRVRTVLSTAIRKIGEAATQYSLAMLSDDDEIIRERSCELLGQIGCADDCIVEALLLASIDKEPEVRKAARDALDRIQAG
jgi:HEAT repeat protein